MADMLRLIDAALLQASEPSECARCGKALMGDEASVDFCSPQCQAFWQSAQARYHRDPVESENSLRFRTSDNVVDVRYPEAVPVEPFIPTWDQAATGLMDSIDELIEFGETVPPELFLRVEMYCESHAIEQSTRLRVGRMRRMLVDTFVHLRQYSSLFSQELSDALLEPVTIPADEAWPRATGGPVVVTAVYG